MYMNAEIDLIISTHPFISDSLLLSTITTYTTYTPRIPTIHYAPLQYLTIYHVDDNPRLLEINAHRHHQSHDRAPGVFNVVETPNTINQRNGSMPRNVMSKYSNTLYRLSSPTKTRR